MRVRLANSSHNEALCRLSARVTMPGSMEVAYLRDPDYFAALEIQGPFHQTIVGLEGDRVVGSGSRSVRPLFVNGESTDLGYLSSLRIHPDHRSRGFLARGYRYLRTLHEDGRCRAYLSTIIEENRYARSLLTRNRAGLPRYEDLGLYLTHALLLNSRAGNMPPPSGLTIERGSPSLQKELVTFLNRVGSRRQFFPRYESREFATPLFRDFLQENWYLARRQGEIVGALALWDQQGFKRNSVVAYSPLLRRSRPLANLALSALGYRPLPPPGKTLSLLHLFSPCIEGEDPEILQALLARILQDQAGSSSSALLLGMHEKDPLRTALKRFPSIVYKSRLFFVFWEDGEELFGSLDPERIPHLEVALL